MTESFDPTPDAVADADEREWRETEQGLDARHRSNGHKPAAEPVRVAIEIDLSPAVVSAGYAQRVVQEIVLDTPQRAVLKLLTSSLEDRGATLCDGTPVRRGQVALQWLLEQIAVRMPQNVLDELMAGVQ